MKSEFPVQTRLLPGQALHVAVDRGQALWVAEGCVSVLGAPGWFGETVLRVPMELAEGESIVFERGGWIEVAAHSQPALVRSLASPVRSPLAVARSWLVGLLRRRASSPMRTQAGRPPAMPGDGAWELPRT